MKRLFAAIGVVAGLALSGILNLLRREPRGEGASGQGSTAAKVASKHPIAAIVTLLAMLGMGALLVATSGGIPVKASAAHWRITAWFLNFGMSRSVSTHAMGIEVPRSLNDPGLVLKGAGHYHGGCRPCHGSPDLKRLRVVEAMRPAPPYLPPRISAWEPEELFYIVKHGVKFTGMPAWPAQQRDDEVWSVVAFLLRLPDLDPEGYQRLVYGEAGTSGDSAPLTGIQAPEIVPHVVLENCGRCHGLDGGGRGDNAFPRLAGQGPEYLSSSLRAFARGTRHSGIMEPIAAGLDAGGLQESADYYAALQALRPADAARESLEAIERGEAIARDGISSRRVPACIHCHGPGDAPRNPAYPTLAGQYAGYLVLQLELFQQERRGGTAYAPLMRPVVSRMTAGDIRDVSLYYAQLAPARAPAGW